MKHNGVGRIAWHGIFLRKIQILNIPGSPLFKICSTMIAEAPSSWSSVTGTEKRKTGAVRWPQNSSFGRDSEG
jgi:hypothetical protein